MSLFHVTFTKTWLPIHVVETQKSCFIGPFSPRKAGGKVVESYRKIDTTRNPQSSWRKEKKVDFHIFAILRYLISLHIDIKSLELILHHLFTNNKLPYFASDMKKKPAQGHTV